MWSRKSRKQSIELSEDAERGAEQVKRLLPDTFSRLVVDAAMRVLRDVDNPIRLNLFAAAVRELVTHVFHDLAPDAKVMACSWYVQDKNTHGPTRLQRPIYIARGGLREDQVGISGARISAIEHDEILKVFQRLNKYTHVRPGSVIEDQEEINRFAAAAFDTFDALFYAVKISRSSIVIGIISNSEPFDRFIEDTFAAAPELADKVELYEHFHLEQLDILDIDAQRVRYRVEGALSDRLRFRIEMNAPVADPVAFQIESCVLGEGEFDTQLRHAFHRRDRA